jgi:ribosomal subunit interface protein
MKINERGINMTITPEIKDFLYSKLAHLDKYIDPADDSIICDVELGMTTRHHKNGDIFKAEINLFMAGKTMRAVAEKEDILSAIDIAKDEIVREITVNKDKKISLVRRGGSKIKGLVKSIFKN